MDSCDSSRHRVFNEKWELDEKIKKLILFSWSYEFHSLPRKHRKLLKKQCKIMITYSEILEKRLDIWDKQ